MLTLQQKKTSPENPEVLDYFSSRFAEELREIEVEIKVDAPNVELFLTMKPLSLDILVILIFSHLSLDDSSCYLSCKHAEQLFSSFFASLTLRSHAYDHVIMHINFFTSCMFLLFIEDETIYLSDDGQFYKMDMDKYSSLSKLLVFNEAKPSFPSLTPLYRKNQGIHTPNCPEPLDLLEEFSQKFEQEPNDMVYIKELKCSISYEVFEHFIGGSVNADLAMKQNVNTDEFRRCKHKLDTFIDLLVIHSLYRNEVYYYSLNTNYNYLTSSIARELNNRK